MDQIKDISGYSSFPASFPVKPAAGQGGEFSRILTSFVNQVDQQIKEADRKAVDFATGKNYDLHEIMISSEKADLSVKLLMQIRNKLLEAYTEIMRMSF